MFTGYLPHLFFAFSLIASVLTVYFHGISTEKGKMAEISLKEVKNHEKIEENVMRLSDGQLDQRLARWLRDR